MPSSAPTTVGHDTNPTGTIVANLRRAFLKGIAIPLIVLLFFAFAPAWLNYRLHSNVAEAINHAPGLTAAAKAERLAAFAKIDFAEVCRAAPPHLQALRADFDQSGVTAHFHRLACSRFLSITLMVVLLAVMAANLLLNRHARRSRDALIWGYRLGWRLSMVAALTKVFLLIPLLAYGTYELTTLAADQYFPKLIVAIVLGGLVALWRSAVILLKEVPLEFEEPMAREIKPAEAPALWQAVRDAAMRLQTAPPDRIVVGMQLNFYVTELDVKLSSGRVEGRTLYLSQPLLKQMAPDEVLAIIGHELGHFIGEDTRITREFYPLRFKANATMLALAQSGWVGWTSVHALDFFNWCFGTTEQAMSRERELQADRTAAVLTSTATAARALVKFQVMSEAIQLGVAGANGQRLENPFEVPLGAFIREQLVPKTEFWQQLFEKKAPHPLDSHPALQVRLDALGERIGPADAIELATKETESAYACWLAGRGELFTELAKEVDAAVGKIRSRVDVAQANCETEAGRQLLEKHFPECRWKIRPFFFWLLVLCWGLVSAGLLTGAVFARDIVWTPVLAVGALLAGAANVAMWRRHRNGEFVLRADALNYTGWQRPLPFANVEKMSAVNSNGGITVTFRLKAKQPEIWKYSLLRFQRKRVSLSLSWIGVKQADVLKTIYRYFARQIEE